MRNPGLCPGFSLVPSVGSGLRLAVCGIRRASSIPWVNLIRLPVRWKTLLLTWSECTATQLKARIPVGL